MKNFEKYLISKKSNIKEALLKLGDLESENVLFVVDENSKLIGSLTDGDVRRGLIRGLNTEESLLGVINDSPKYLVINSYSLSDLILFRENNYKVVPVIDKNGIVKAMLNFRKQKSLLPVDAIIMAGGKGTRLRPLTESTPKPLLKVGDKEIISYNFDRLFKFGITNQNITVNYLGEQLEEYCKAYHNKNINFNVFYEKEFYGTAGSISLIEDYKNEDILLMNSDLLTNIDYEDFYKSFKEKDADIMVASIPYDVNLPYAVLNTTQERQVTSFQEKPTYTYHTNAGIYLIKKSVLDLIPKNKFYNATDLMEDVIKSLNGKLMHYPIRGYWLDIGKHKDFEKAQRDIYHLDFD
ncbi:sugar phosphate nucleotidyltransferase [Tenacibaculum sp.]|uniref:sugar phosphate nucleotidyltransferase n=1 Tax=Tenacibaculum sp. TaxID=1906242 RepID=UPI003D0AC61A